MDAKKQEYLESLKRAHRDELERAAHMMRALGNYATANKPKPPEPKHEDNMWDALLYHNPYSKPYVENETPAPACPEFKVGDWVRDNRGNHFRVYGCNQFDISVIHYMDGYEDIIDLSPKDLVLSPSEVAPELPEHLYKAANFYPSNYLAFGEQKAPVMPVEAWIKAAESCDLGSGAHNDLPKLRAWLDWWKLTNWEPDVESTIPIPDTSPPEHIKVGDWVRVIGESDVWRVHRVGAYWCNLIRFRFGEAVYKAVPGDDMMQIPEPVAPEFFNGFKVTNPDDLRVYGETAVPPDEWLATFRHLNEDDYCRVVFTELSNYRDWWMLREWKPEDNF